MTDTLTPAQRHEIEGDLAAARAEAAERVRNQMTLAEKSLSALMVANGGALIGMFTFIGNIAVKSPNRSEEHTSELQSLMRISYAVFCLKKKKQNKIQI